MGARGMTAVAQPKEAGLRRRALGAGAWVLTGRVVSRIVTVTTSLVLARLLTPSDFGLVAMGVLALSLLEVLTAVGVRDALIQREGDIGELLDSAWTIEILRGATISGLLFLAAPAVAVFFREPAAVAIIRAVSVIPLLRGLENIGTVLFRKELDFRKDFKLEASRVIAHAVVGISLAVALRSVWALVAAQIVGYAVQSVVSYVLSPVRPAFRLDWAQARGLYGFGKWVLLGGLIGYAQLQADTFFVARFFSPAELGLYTLAFTISNVVIVDIGKAIAKVMFPVYSMGATDMDRVTRGLLDAYELVAAATLPLCVGLALVADDFTLVVLGEDWASMIPVLRVLAIAACCRALAVSGSGFFWGIGRPHVTFRMNLLQLFVLAAGLIVLPPKFGLLGVAAAFGTGYGAYVVQFLHETVVRCGIGVRRWAKKLAPLCFEVGALAAAVTGARQLMGPGAERLIVSVVVGGVVYLAMSVLVLRVLGYGQLQTAASLGLSVRGLGRLGGRA